MTKIPNFSMILKNENFICFGHWILEFEIYLLFGTWNLRFINSNLTFTRR